MKYQVHDDHEIDRGPVPDLKNKDRCYRPYPAQTKNCPQIMDEETDIVRDYHQNESHSGNECYEFQVVGILQTGYISDPVGEDEHQYSGKTASYREQYQ